MQGPLSRLAAFEERTASRHAPRPRMVVVQAAMNLLTFVIIGTGGVLDASPPDGNGTVGWALVGLCAAAFVLTFFASVWRWRRAVDRAASIYGAEWRSLTKADRAMRWRAYQERTMRPYDWRPPSDPSNPYSAPAS
jgi:hypothetical protein